MEISFISPLISIEKKEKKKHRSKNLEYETIKLYDPQIHVYFVFHKLANNVSIDLLNFVFSKKFNAGGT